MNQDKSKVELLANEYTDWLVENLDKEYIETQCCYADSILRDSVALKLNEDQKLWLKRFITRWDKAYL